MSDASTWISAATLIVCSFGVYFLNRSGSKLDGITSKLDAKANEADLKDLAVKVDGKAEQSSMAIAFNRIDGKMDKDMCVELRAACINLRRKAQ